MKIKQYVTKLKVGILVSLILILLVPFSVVFAAVITIYEHWQDEGTPKWQHDILSVGKSNYAETEVVPHFFGTKTSLDTAKTYAFNIYYDYLKDGTCGFYEFGTYDIDRMADEYDIPNYTPDAFYPIPPNLGYGDFDLHNVDIKYISTDPIPDGVYQYIQIAFSPVTTGPIGIYYGLRLAKDDDCGTGNLGSYDYSGGSLQTFIKGTPLITGFEDATYLSSGSGSLQLMTTGITPTDIAGIKFFDIDGDGPSPGDPGLENWTIKLYQCTDSTCTTYNPTDPVQTDITNAAGSYLFTGLTVGETYQVCEIVGGPYTHPDPKWQQTWPTTISGCSEPILITEDADTYLQDFGNWLGKDAVTLTNFAAEPQNINIAVLVEWQTIMQTDTLGFNLYRSLGENGKMELIGYIPVKIPDGGGAEYEYLDDEVLPGKTYYYWLEAVDINGSSEVFDPVAATWWWKSYVPMITR